MNDSADSAIDNRPQPAGGASIGLWLRALRAPFFQAVLVPLVLGTAAAWYHTDQFHLGYFLLAMAGVLFIHAGTNLANDYFDHKTGADELNEQYTRFSGGSRMIQEGLLAPGAILRVSLACFAAGAGVGLCLVFARGWQLLIIGLIGVVSGYSYTAAPLRLGYRGWGEAITGLNCGPLVVLGAYFVQTGQLSWEALLASVPVGILIAAILYVNEFSDYDADKAAGKANLVVRLGPARAVKGFYLLLVCTYAVIILACAFRAIPWPGAAALLTIPLAWKAARVARAHHAAGSGRKMVPAMAGTIATHLLTGLLLSCGYLAAGMLK